jgi:hypothetical protein
MQGLKSAKCLLRGALASAFALILGVKGMQASGKRRHIAEAEQNLVKQVCATLRKGNSEQNRPAILRRGQGCKTCMLNQFFGLVNEAAKRGFEGHRDI